MSNEREDLSSAPAAQFIGYFSRKGRKGAKDAEGKRGFRDFGGSN